MERFYEMAMQMAAELDDTFWEKWENKLDRFPDTEDGMKGEIIVLEIALTTIVCHYLSHFKKEYRKDFMEELFKNIRCCERALPFD